MQVKTSSTPPSALAQMSCTSPYIEKGRIKETRGGASLNRSLQRRIVSSKKIRTHDTLNGITYVQPHYSVPWQCRGDASMHLEVF